jgi:serine/threonine protein kinase
MALAAALADSLGRLHSAGVVHRDVKPSNIQIGPQGPILLDLGVSKSEDSTSLTTIAMSIGTPAWMSPEQWRGADHGPAGDMWNWGAVVAFGAGGTHPFGSGTDEALGYRILHETPTLPALAEPLEGLVAAALDKDPANRPDWQEILNALDTDHSTVLAYVSSRWGRLGPLALASTASEDAPTVLLAETPDTMHALAPTRLEPAGPVAEPETPRRRRIAIVAGLATLLFVGTATAIMIGQAASAPIEPPAPTPSPSAITPGPSEVPDQPSVEPSAASTPPTAEQPTALPTKAHGKPPKDHGKPPKKPGKG